jgi:hypothetical protein
VTRVNWKQAVAVAVVLVLVGAMVLDFPWEPDSRAVGLLTLLEWGLTLGAIIAVIAWVPGGRAWGANTMNLVQRVVLLIGLLVIAAMGLFSAWLQRVGGTDYYYTQGYGPLFRAPPGGTR